MTSYYEFFIYLLLLLFINFSFIKNNFLIDLPNIDKHKKKIFFSQKVPKSLGIIIILFINFNIQFSVFEKLFIFLIFFLGVLSDVKKINSPKVRFFLQALIIFMLLSYSGHLIQSTKIPFIDQLLEFNLFRVILTLFCILIIINGSNFIDGLNTLCLGYYLSISFILFLFDLNEIYQSQYIYFFIFILTLLYLFNFFGKSFLGDAGSYLLGILFSVILITMHSLNSSISPWFVAVLLWYPAFEILFTIIRRSINSKNAFFPDNRHFHQLLYLYFKKKFNLRSPFLNPVVANLINLYNLGIFYLAYNYYNLSLTMISIFVFNCFIYLYVYMLLNKNISS